MNGQRLRPLSLGDIFDEGFDLYKRNFVFLLLVTAVMVVPLDIFLSFIGPRLMAGVYGLFDMTAQSDSSGLWLVGAGVKLAIYLPLYALALGPLVVAASGCYLQQNVTVWASVKPWLRRLPGLALCFLLTGVLLNLGLSICLIGWPIAASLLLFTPQAFLLEQKGPFRALSRSSALVNGYGGRAFVCLLGLGLILWVIGLGIKLPLAYVFETALSIGPKAGSLAEAGGDTGQQVVTMLSSGLTHLLLFPFLVSVLTALYYDMRIRKEGFDIDLLAEDLGYLPLAALNSYLPPVAVFVPIRPVSAPPKSGPRGIGR